MEFPNPLEVLPNQPKQTRREHDLEHECGAQYNEEVKIIIAS